MSINSDKRIIVKVLALSVMVFGLLLFSKDSTKALLAPSQVPSGGAQLPTVTKADQAGAPLRIIDVLVEAPSPDRVVVRAVLQNQSGKKIRAMAVAADTRIQFLNFTSGASILLPTQVKALDVAYAGDDKPKGVNLSVDFVEFDDGTTWGVDMGNSRDRLAGQRDGAKAERRRLKNLFKSKGRLGLSDLPEGGVSDGPGAPAGGEHSEEWLQGYRNGVGAIRRRVRQALQTNNSDRVRPELDKPYDTSEGNK